MPDQADSELTEIETRVLELAAEGRHDADVASMLGLPPEEVRAHVENAFAKLELQRKLVAASKMVARDNHTHPDHSMNDEELLAHLRFLHARGVPKYHLVDPDELPSLHRSLHGWTSPSRA